MTVRFSQSPAGFRRAAAFALAVTLFPLPLAAAEQGTKPTPVQAVQPLQTSIARHASREVLVTSPKRTERTAATSNAQRNNPHSSDHNFFRSPAGIACLAVIGAGTAFALYSASHDRIHSVAREGQK